MVKQLPLPLGHDKPVMEQVMTRSPSAKIKLKKLLTKQNTHDIISELLLEKVSNNEP